MCLGVVDWPFLCKTQLKRLQKRMMVSFSKADQISPCWTLQAGPVLVCCLTLFKCHQQDEMWCKETPLPPFSAPLGWGCLASLSPALVLGLMPGPSGPSQAR